MQENLDLLVEDLFEGEFDTADGAASYREQLYEYKDNFDQTLFSGVVQNLNLLIDGFFS